MHIETSNCFISCTMHNHLFGQYTKHSRAACWISPVKIELPGQHRQGFEYAHNQRPDQLHGGALDASLLEHIWNVVHRSLAAVGLRLAVQGSSQPSTLSEYDASFLVRGPRPLAKIWRVASLTDRWCRNSEILLLSALSLFMRLAVLLQSMKLCQRK